MISVILLNRRFSSWFRDECSTGAAAPREGVDAFSIGVAERDHIVRVLAQCNGRKMEAARLLGINNTTLWRKMNKFGTG